MSDLTVQQVTERLLVTHAPARAEISLALLVQSIKGIYLDHHDIVVGYPYEEEVRYRIVGFDPSTLMFQTEKVGG